MSLLQVLLEDSHDLVKQAEAFYAPLNSDQKERTKTALQKLAFALEEKKIFNVDFGEIKGLLGRMYETAIKLLDAKLNRDVGRNLYMYYDFDSYPQFNGVKKQIRGLEKALKEKSHGEAGETDSHYGPVIYKKEDLDGIQSMIELHKAAQLIKTALDEVKPFIIKGRKPSEKEQDPNAFHRKIGNKEAQDKVKGVISESIKDRMDDYEKSIEDFFQGTINQLVKAGSWSFEKGKPNHMDFFYQQILRACFEYEHTSEHSMKGKVEYKKLKLAPAGKTYAKEEAKRERDALEKRFLHKAVLKLSHIVELKGNLDQIHPLPTRPIQIHQGTGTIECGFKFTFGDGSEFTVVNKVVVKSSYTGKAFEQFPTTFHDVKLADGKPMKQPSEEKMVKEFAK